MPGVAASPAQSSADSGRGGVLVTGDDGDLGRHAALGDRDAGIGGHRERRRHARHDLERHAGGAQRERLLAAAAEDERVAALEPHDAFAAAGRARPAAR